MYKLFIILAFLSASLSLVKCDLNILNKNEGDDCVWSIPDKGEFQGKCVNERRCLTTLDQRGDKPPVCSTDGAVTIVCCTDCQLINDTSNVIISPGGLLLWKDGRKFRDHCLQYMDERPNKCPGFYGGVARYLETGKTCHSYSRWAVGGDPPLGQEPPTVNPYEAYLGFGKELSTAKWKTTGAIISEKFILTSVFDAVNTEGLPLKFVAVGVTLLRSGGLQWQKVGVERVHVHPQYVPGQRYNYLALVELKAPIFFNRDVFPACLPDPLATFDASTAELMEYVDLTKRDKLYADLCRTVKLSELAAANCSAQLTSKESRDLAEALPRGVDDATQVCYTGEATTVLGTPLVVNTHLDRCMNTVVGIKVFGGEGAPSVFAKVSAYVDWIENIVWP